MLNQLQIGDITVKIPIIQGGMGVGISLSNLASAVAEQGGIGVISATGIAFLAKDLTGDIKAYSTIMLNREISAAKKKTKGIIGVNILVALTDYEELLVSSYDAGADLFFLGAGLPLKFSDAIPKEKLNKILKKIVPIVSSDRAAVLICQTWKRLYNYIPNAFVVEGPLAGGHLGFKKDAIFKDENKLEIITASVIEALKPYEKEFEKNIPVIAAGGIYTGDDIYKIMKLGAKGVQLGTRFVATTECDADDSFKQEYINCRQEDIIIIQSPVGLPGRAIKNQYLTDVSAGLKKPFKCLWKCLKTCDVTKAPYCIALALFNAQNGNINNGFAFSGANAYRISKIISVKELFSELISEYNYSESIDKK
ncbi:nitronate monooxygenase [Candidatus Dependentiae bacterium]|nr:nitronate monooxygenase [Candidatus Dependentiae bacterium]